jgi:hypothetical protein
VSALSPDAVHHAENCFGFPMFQIDSAGQWSASCSQVAFLHNRCPSSWEVSGCESRAEAGATFYGHDPRGG